MTTFRAKARAVELLGKGQIADLPTAITELWKNGYDAYARNLVCKLFLESYKDNKKPVFLLSDDGFGMSEDDILNRWFVLGTDSKARGHKSRPHFGLEQRTPMGEKGIGRLSVAFLGSQMLMVSKEVNKSANAVLMDWRVLDNYDFYLSDLNIPVFDFSDIDDFTSKFQASKNDFLENLDRKLWPEQSQLRDAIEQDWQNLAISGFVYDEVLKDFCRKDYHGTSFLIFTPHEQLLELSDKERIKFKNDSALKYLRASLSGLHNDLENPKKDFETHFILYDSSGKYNIIDDFFTQQEMRSADHWLKGEFDEKGFFTGEIRVFNKKVAHTFRPNRPPGDTSYGPLKIEWGSVEGNETSSTLNEQQFRMINKKLDTFGGLYVYRDGFRVLPYGRTEADFLEFEKRRSMGAGYYFFSHRRFIGYISLSREKNSELKDKAGREGFIQNKAFREFRDDLSAFFIDIARRYMRKTPEGEEDTFRQSQIDGINSKFALQEKAAKNKGLKTRKAFLEKLAENNQTLNALSDQISTLDCDLDLELIGSNIDYNRYNNLLRAFDEKKSDFRALRLQKPKGVQINRRQEEDYHSFQGRFAETEDKIRAIEKIIDDTRQRLNVENLRNEFNDKFKLHLKNLDKQFSEFQSTTRDSLNRLQQDLRDEKEQQVNSFIERSESVRLLEADDREIIASKIEALERLIGEQNFEIADSIGSFVSHVSNLQIDVDDDFLRSWYQEQNQNLAKKLSDYEELAQLGMSIEIIDHQFNVMYSQMSDAVADFDRFSQKHPEIEYSFRQLKNAFQHLEGNYKLLKPLYRTSRRTREVITGYQLEKYIREFFANEFQRYRIDFSVNNGFRDYEFFSYDSIIKPVFLNLINNANYWLIPSKERRIKIELENDKILVMNSGERIDDSYLEDIFTLFFTRKRDGRGIGLYLAKKNLQSVGYDIYATNDKDYNRLKGACFIITKLETSEE